MAFVWVLILSMNCSAMVGGAIWLINGGNGLLYGTVLDGLGFEFEFEFGYWLLFGYWVLGIGIEFELLSGGGGWCDLVDRQWLREVAVGG